MKTSDFSFEIPNELIAQQPCEQRDGARMLCLNRHTGSFHHSKVNDLPDLLPPEALLVFNNTRVRRCRLPARTINNGRPVELLLLEQLPGGEWNTILGPARRARPGTRLLVAGDRTVTVLDQTRETARVVFEPTIDEAYLLMHGHVPLPPYIRRPDLAQDGDRYQTVYAQQTGSAAAPTAGLHFSEQLLSRIDQKGIERCFVTLHVGLGTFQPIRSDLVVDHLMHTESYEVPETTATAVTAARRNGRPIVAVGTTSVRTLESAWSELEGGHLRPGSGHTGLFIYPGFHFRVVDEMFTNFHTPQSSLIVMVSAFAGRQRILNAYAAAIEQRYRFFSYGDAMYIRGAGDGQ